MVGILGLLKIRGVAGSAFRRGTLIAVGMAFDAIDADMRPGQWEIAGVVVKRVVCTAGRVTGQTSVAVVQIPADTVVLVVGLGVDMAIGTRHLGII